MRSQSNSLGLVGVISLLFTVLTALYLLIGGAWLLAVGGSAYYVVTGVVLLGVAWLLWRRSPAALVLYAIVLVGTAIWALLESGPDFWALAPRSGRARHLRRVVAALHEHAAGRRAQAGCRVAHCCARGMGGRARVRELQRSAVGQRHTQCCRARERRQHRDRRRRLARLWTHPGRHSLLALAADHA